MTPPPSLGNIRDDDALLDALGGRRAPARRDDVSDLLQAWVSDIDATEDAPAKPRRTRPAHLAAAVGLAVTALSVSSMAAAVTDHRVPVLYQLGSVAGSVFGGPLHAASGGGADQQAKPQLPAATDTSSDTSNSPDAPAPRATSSGTSPSDLPRSTTAPKASTPDRGSSSSAGGPAPAPTATPDSPSSPDRPSRSTSSSEPGTSSSDRSSSSSESSTSRSSSSRPSSSTSSDHSSTSSSSPTAEPTAPAPSSSQRTRPTLPTPNASPKSSLESSQGEPQSTQERAKPSTPKLPVPPRTPSAE